MLLGYIDESYDNQECWLTAVLVSDADHAAASGQLRRVRDTAVERHGLSPNVELRGYDVFHGENAWAPLKPVPRQRISVYESVLRTIADNGGRIIHSGAVRAHTEKRWPEHHPTEHAHRVAFFGLMTEVAALCTAENDRALLIADEVSVQSKVALRNDVRWLQDRERRDLDARRIIDTVHFIGSHESILIQAADMVGFIHRRARMKNSERAEKVNRRLSRVVDPLVIARRAWPDQPFP